MITWGIVGLGKMANQFANAIKEVDNAQLIAIASKSILKLNQFSKEYHINNENQFLNYEDLFKLKSVDAIYISTLNNTHLQLIINASKYKKKILCEKPIGLNLKEANLASTNITKYKVFFYEAIAYRSHPQTKNLLRLIKEGEIGDIYKIESTFGFKVKKIKKDSRLFNKNLGGGAILDVGCYPISFFNLFCKENEQLEFKNSNGSYASTGVEDEAEINLSIGEKIHCIGKVSLKQNLSNTCKIYGNKGTIEIASPWLPSNKSYLEISNDKSYYKKFTLASKSLYSLQIESISESFLNKNKMNNQLVDIVESIKIMKVLDMWKKNLV